MPCRVELAESNWKLENTNMLICVASNLATGADGGMSNASMCWKYKRCRL